MLINLELAEKRITSQSNLVNKLIERSKNRGPNLSDEKKVEIGVDAHLMTLKETAKKHAVDTHTVQVYKSGRDFKNQPIDKDVENKIQTRVEQVKDEAVEKLMLALGLIDNQNLRNLKAKDLSVIAANLAAVAQRTSDKSTTTNATQIIIYGPKQREVGDYEVIEVAS